MPIPGETFACRAERRRVRDAHDRTMTESCKMPDRDFRTVTVVDQNRVGCETPHGAIDLNEWETVGHGTKQMTVCALARRHDEPVHLTVSQRLDKPFLPRRVLVGVGEEHGVAVVLELVRDCSRCSGKEWVLDIRDDKPDRQRCPLDKCASDRVRPVAQGIRSDPYGLSRPVACVATP